MRDFKAWHLHKQGFNAYYSAYLVLDGRTMRNNIAQLPNGKNTSARPLAIGFGRSTPFIVTITNADIQNFYTGIALPTRDKDHDVVFTVEDSYLRNYVNITRTADGTHGPLIIRDTPLPLANTVTLSSGPNEPLNYRGQVALDAPPPSTGITASQATTSASLSWGCHAMYCDTT